MSGILTCKQGTTALNVFVLMAWTLVGFFMSLSCWIWDAVDSCPPQPDRFFQKEAWALAEQVLVEVEISAAGDDQFQQALV